MLELLRIQNYALIDELEVEFESGFNVLTGETGAGKSIIVGALNLVLGARATADIVRDGADRAKIEALFRVDRPSRRLSDLLNEFGIERVDGELLISRTITADGRSRAHAGGELLTLAQLAQLGDELVDLHGQHEHQSLIQTDRQLALLDAFADLERDVDRIGELVAALRESEKAIAALESVDRERERRIEFLKFEIAEIDAANLQPGEEEDVRTRRNLITNAEKVFTLASQAYAALYEGDGTCAIDAVDAAISAVTDLQTVDPKFDALLDRLNSIRADIEEVSTELRGYTREVEYDADELDALNRRLSQIGDLKRKFGESIEVILGYRASAAAEVEQFAQRDQRLAELHAAHAQQLREATAFADDISARRKSAAARLDKKVTAALQELGMKSGRFETRFESIPLSRDGTDRVEFLLAANVGEKAKPLRQVASGGEISRVMLAIKTVLASADKIPTLIFDEIDAGVGGAVANKVASRLRELALTHQTICITHLPQIAAAARAHFTVAKAASKGRTSTRIERIDGEERVRELARLLDGTLSAVSIEHARELLKTKQ